MSYYHSRLFLGFLLFSLLLIVGLYFGYTEGIRADELGTSPRIIQNMITWICITVGLLGNLAIYIISSHSKE